MRVEFDMADMVSLLRRLQRQSQNIRPVLVTAHRNMAEFLQAEIADELNDRIKERGRTQRGGALIRAIKSPDSIRVDESGYTFGFLEHSEGNVRLYARNLDIGTDVHVGTELVGFMREGKLVPATRNRAMQTDPRMVQVSEEFRRTLEERKESRKFSAGHMGSDEADDNIVEVKRAIQGYRFFENGMERWREGFNGIGGLTDSLIATYHGAFRDAGLDVYEIFFREYGLVPPSAGRAALQAIEGDEISEDSSAYIHY
jgi:hypothetical protein